jgi:predicted metalloprotease
MRWQGRRQSTNIRDVRGSGGELGGLGGGLGGGYSGGLGGRRGPIGVRRAGGGGIGAVIVILVIAYFLGVNPLELLDGNLQSTPSSQSQRSVAGVSDEMRDFVATVLADTEDTWGEIFRQGNEDYPEPTLTLFSGSVASACGRASSSTGPFYCPGDNNLYIDLGFYDELRSRFGAPGDFAQAYVLAHEVGHHVQNVLGILPKVHEERARLGEAEANALSVRTELQADCFAGIWANHTAQRGLLEEGDIDEALTAAAAVGDDRLQQQGQGYVVPDSFTHGTSEQRAEWFKRGYEQGTVGACDTFNAAM